tara:strand:- start:14613 stop:15437 length:825 start_codon:yes stop_codon:yes gene_type:complete
MKINDANIQSDSDNESVASSNPNQDDVTEAEELNKNEEDNISENEDGEDVDDVEEDDNDDQNADQENEEEEVDEIDEDDIDDEELSTIIETKKGSKTGKKTQATAISLSEAMHTFVDDESDSDDNNEEDVQISGVLGDDEYDEDDEDPDTYFQKFDEEINTEYLETEHSIQFNKNYDEISTLCNIVRDENNNIVDPLHTTIPYLTKYEKSRILGQRAKQINSGATPFVDVPDKIMDGFIIAQMELAQKRIPAIIQRPIYGGGCEYWKLKDLEIL